MTSSMFLPGGRQTYEPADELMHERTDEQTDGRGLRRLVLVDGLLALAIGVVTAAPLLVYPTAYIVDTGEMAPTGGAMLTDTATRWSAIAVVTAIVAPLVFRRMVPRLSFAAVALISIASVLPAVVDATEGVTMFIGGINLPMLVSVFTLANVVGRRGAVATGVAGAAALSTVAVLPFDGLRNLLSFGGLGLVDIAVYSVMPTALVVLVAQVLRDQRIRADIAQSETAKATVQAELRVATAASAERRRLASELHDIVAHHVNLMVVQAEKGPFLRDIDASKQTYATIAETGRTALGELDRLLGVLRTDGTASPGAATTAPLPTLHEVPGLIAAATSAGVEIELVAFDVPATVDPAISATIHRIVQECITNVVKHGDHRKPAEVTITSTGSVITIEVTNLVRAGRSTSRRGYGLESMRSRVEAFGGTIRVEDADGRYRVEALVPLSSPTSICASAVSA